MDQSLGCLALSESKAFEKVPTRQTNNEQKSNKCNQCDFASVRTNHLRRHLKTHSGEKPNKCNQCDYKSSRADVLRTHLKTHSGERQIFYLTNLF